MHLWNGCYKITELQNIFITLEESLYSFAIHPSWSSSSWTPPPTNRPHSEASHCFLHYRLSLYFLVFYVNEIIQPALFASAFFQVVGQFWDSFICFNSVPFLLIAEQCSIAWMWIFSLHLLTDIQVTSWFGLLWNIPAMNICVQVFI